MGKNAKDNAVEESFLNCSLDDLVAKNKKKFKKGKKGFKKSWNKGRGGRGRGRGRGRRGRGGRGRGSMKRKVYTKHFKRQPKNPLNRLQQLAQTYNLMPTIAVLQQGAQGVQISIEMDISPFEKKPAGAVVLRQVAWGKTQDQAKTKAVKEILKHKSIKALTVSGSQPLFPEQMGHSQKGKKKKKKQRNKKEGEGTWISSSCFFNHPNIALTLFEKFLTERGSLVEYKESGEYPECKVECVVDGNVISTGTAKGMWTAKKFAIKHGYFNLKNAEKKGEGKGETTEDTEQKEGEETKA